MRTRLAIVALAAIGVWQVASGAYIHGKAWLAQQLIASAWTRTLAGEREVKPWPWADTWPVARLQVTGTVIDLYVLADASGRSLAFGPGYVSSSAAIGAGNTVIAGHRDTHFAFLRDLHAGDDLEIQTVDGRAWRFQVEETHVFDSRRERLAFGDGAATVTLLTCYPFDAIAPGGPLRYVAVAGLLKSEPRRIGDPLAANTNRKTDEERRFARSNHLRRLARGLLLPARGPAV